MVKEKLQFVRQLMTDLTEILNEESILELEALEPSEWNVSSASIIFRSRSVVSVLKICLSELMELAQENSTGCDSLSIQSDPDDPDEANASDEPESSESQKSKQNETPILSERQAEKLQTVQELLSDLTDSLSTEAVDDLECMEHPEWNIGSVCAVSYARSYATVLSKHLTEFIDGIGAVSGSREAAASQSLTGATPEADQYLTAAVPLPFADDVDA